MNHSCPYGPGPPAIHLYVPYYGCGLSVYMQVGTGGPAHIPNKAQALQQGEQQGREIQLETAGAVAGGRGGGVVIVMPGFPETGQGEPPNVPRVVAGVVRAGTPEMADRVHRPRHMVEQDDTQQPRPQQHTLRDREALQR